MIGVNFDGSGRHVISTKTDGLSVSLTRDGEHVVYSFWGASGADADATHVNSFAGIAERLLIDPAVEKSYYSKTGLFIPGDDAKQLLYGFLADGAVYRSLETEPAILVNWWGGRLLDADDDLQTVLTESTVNPWIGELTCYTSRFEEDSDKDGLGDNWERLHFGNLDDPSVWIRRSSSDDDDDGFRNDAEYQLGTNPNNKDTDGDGLDDATEYKRTGTDPLDARSRLAVETVAIAQGQLRIRWNTARGKSYRVQTSIGLGASDAWQNLSESIKGDGKGTEFSAAPPTQTTAVFYRVILE